MQFDVAPAGALVCRTVTTCNGYKTGGSRARTGGTYCIIHSVPNNPSFVASARCNTSLKWESWMEAAIMCVRWPRTTTAKCEIPPCQSPTRIVHLKRPRSVAESTLITIKNERHVWSNGWMWPRWFCFITNRGLSAQGSKYLSPVSKHSFRLMGSKENLVCVLSFTNSIELCLRKYFSITLLALKVILRGQGVFLSKRTQMVLS